MNLLLAVLSNLISDVVGGIEVTSPTRNPNRPRSPPCKVVRP